MKTTKVVGLVLASVAYFMVGTAQADITQREAAQAVINYEAYAKAKENAAAAIEKYAPPPLLAAALTSSNNAGQALALVPQNNQVLVQRLVQGSMMGINPYPLSGAGGGGSYDLNTHYGLFCIPWEAAMMGSSCGSSTLPAGDLTVSTLLGTPRIDATDMTSLVAADAIIRGITQFSVVPLLASPQENLSAYPPSRQEELKGRLNQIAQGSVAMNSFSNMFSMRLPQPITPLLSGGGGGSGSSQPLVQSLMEVLQTESTRRFTDPAWTTAMLTASDSALLRELANMESFRLYMDYLRFQQMERIEALLAASLSAQLATARADSARQQSVTVVEASLQQ